MSVDSFFLSSLAKVFLDEVPIRYEHISEQSMLKNEKFNFQFVYFSKNDLENIRFKISSDIDEYINIYNVESVPVLKPVSENNDSYYLRKTPGLYPDILRPYKSECINLPANQWRSFWIEIDGDCNIPCGTHSIIATLEKENGEEICQETFSLEIIDACLPEQSLICTNWFHCDSLATYYNTEVFSDKFWSIVENFIDTAVKHGINFILTPLFTPPLDTKVGEERLTVQLIDVKVENGKYIFGFDKLKNWIEICQKHNVKYFEMSHLFTQWGAEHAPKIVAEVDGEMKQIFGWDTDSCGKEYENFLRSLSPLLTETLIELGVADKCYFHVSDEPGEKDLEKYSVVSSLMRELFGKNFKIIDALSDFSFYSKGLVTIPIPCVSSIESFYQKVSELWTYYCCGPSDNFYTNRFISMPSQRTRILGMLLYKYDVKGFLQWGYNFYFTKLSQRKVNPFTETDAGCAFSAGDAFVVYPGDDGKAIPSIRLKVFYDAFQDMRSLQLLESLIGKEETIRIIEQDGEYLRNLSFENYPRSDSWHIKKRDEINKLIKSKL